MEQPAGAGPSPRHCIILSSSAQDSPCARFVETHSQRDSLDRLDFTKSAEDYGPVK